MSTLLRLVRSGGIRNGLTFLAPKDAKVQHTLRLVSSTPKKNDTSSEEPYVALKKTWVSYGFDYKNEKLDRFYMHQMFFAAISCCIVGGIFILAYLPDPTLRDWAQREAYLQIRYKEEHGLPYINPDVIDTSKFTLPSDEELGDTEIII